MFSAAALYVIPNLSIISNGEPYVGESWEKYLLSTMSWLLIRAVLVSAKSAASGASPIAARSLFTRSSICCSSTVNPDVDGTCGTGVGLGVSGSGAGVGAGVGVAFFGIFRFPYAHRIDCRV
ncbi:hypothetical protein D3C85_1365320 [compost metagenome]